VAGRSTFSRACIGQLKLGVELVRDGGCGHLIIRESHVSVGLPRFILNHCL
jgi:hypothetical protein